MNKSRTVNPTAERRQPPLPLRFSILLLFLALVLANLAYGTATIYNVIENTKETSPAELRDRPFWDFLVFYAAADNLVGDSENVYDRETMMESIGRMYSLERADLSDYGEGLLRYYNPPFFLLLLTPLTLLDIPTAYLVTVAVNLAALAGLIILVGVALRWRQPFTLLTAAAMTAFLPTHIAVIHAQPNIIIAVLILGAFLAAERKRTLLASVLLVLSSAKPQWAFLPSLALLRQNPTALRFLIVAGSVVVLAPFLVLGAGVLVDYVSVLTERSGADLTESRYSAHLHNWVGFFRALTGSPQPVATTIATLLTLAVLAGVFLRGDRELTWAAAIFATIIVTPHSHAQEWLLAVPATAFLLRRQMAPSAQAVTCVLLLAVFVGTTASIMANDLVLNGSRFVYGQVPVAFALILWCAALPVLERSLPLMTRPQLSVPVAA